MAEIKVELQGEDVNRETIVKMVNEYVKGLSNSYDNPLKKVIEAEVRTQVQLLVQERLPEIKEKIATQFSGDVVDKVVSGAMEKLLKSLY